MIFQLNYTLVVLARELFNVTFYLISFYGLRTYSFYEVRLAEAGFTNNNNNKPLY